MKSIWVFWGKVSQIQISIQVIWCNSCLVRLSWKKKNDTTEQFYKDIKSKTWWVMIRYKFIHLSLTHKFWLKGKKKHYYINTFYYWWKQCNSFPVGYFCLWASVQIHISSTNIDVSTNIIRLSTAEITQSFTYWQKHCDINNHWKALYQ